MVPAAMMAPAAVLPALKANPSVMDGGDFPDPLAHVFWTQ